MGRKGKHGHGHLPFCIENEAAINVLREMNGYLAATVPFYSCCIVFYFGWNSRPSKPRVYSLHSGWRSSRRGRSEIFPDLTAVFESIAAKLDSPAALSQSWSKPGIEWECFPGLPGHPLPSRTTDGSCARLTHPSAARLLPRRLRFAQAHAASLRPLQGGRRAPPRPRGLSCPRSCATGARRGRGR
jgi:hypothetical protein